MTPAEITAHVMSLSPEQVDRACAEDVMGWTLDDQHWFKGFHIVRPETGWHPSTDRNQSRLVTDKVGCDHEMRGQLESAICKVTGTPNRAWQTASPLDESRAALIAHYIHRGGIE